jgi:formate-dependent nitrite reductase membrane component NrfD
MPEITLTGANAMTFPNMATWGWEIAVYLFLGGLVAGLMIFGGALNLVAAQKFQRALLISNLTALPILGIGMLFLLFDLSNKINVWRFYTTFQLTSPMSWGAWILLFAMIVLALKFVSVIPAPRATTILGAKLFQPIPTDVEEAKEAIIKKPSALVRLLEWKWNALYALAQFAHKHDTTISLASILLGIGVGFYTGILLSSIPSRPLWNSSVIAPLFLISGLASGGAFLCLFIPHDEHELLVPFSVLTCGVELIFLLAYAINMIYGAQGDQRAGGVLFNGIFAALFWGVVVLLGLIVPATIESFDALKRPLAFVPARVPPLLKLTGGVALRFVIVYAGLLSFL